MNPKKILATAGPTIASVFFSAALYFLFRELREIHYHELAAVVRSIPARTLLSSMAFTLLSYLALGGYDALGVRYAGLRLGYPVTALISFVSYVFSNNFGFGALTGGLVRYRLYSAFGIGAADSARIAGFCALTFWAGVLLLGGTALTVSDFPWPFFAARMPFSTRALGVAMLILFAAYCAVSMSVKSPVGVGRWTVVLPSWRIIAGQIGVAIVDWLGATAAMYVLLPPEVRTDFPRVVAVFMFSQILGLISHVPGGIGVFEATMVFCLPAEVPRKELFGALLAYRGVYYLGPLGLATLTMSAFEARGYRAGIGRGYAKVRRIANPMAAPLAAMLVFLSGALLLLSGSTRGLPHRLEWLYRALPLAVLETSHFLASLAGLALLLVARGLQLRLIAASRVAFWLLCGGIALSLLKGFDFEEATVLGMVLLILIFGRGAFHRETPFREESFTPAWIAFIGMALLSALWLGFFSYKHMEYRHDLWWNFALHANASRFLRASVGVAGAVCLFSIWRTLHPPIGKATLTPTGPDEIAKAEPIAKGNAKSFAYLSLVGDKSLLFNGKGNAFIMFAGAGRSLVAMGDPVGPEEESQELIWSFRRLCDQYAAYPVFYQVDESRLAQYIEIGLSFMKLGEEALIPLDRFNLESPEAKSMRYCLRHAEKAGISFQVLAPDQVDARMEELRAVSESWLRSKNTREKRFSLGYFEPAYLRACPVAIALKEGRVLAFANLWPGGGKEELSIDLMRFHESAPREVMEFLIISLLAYGKAEGFHWFNLGMAPLSGITGGNLAPAWARMGTFLFEHGEHFYNFQGLRQYKEKFDPVWKPRFLASPGGIALPVVLSNLATLISGGMKGLVSR